MLGQVGTAEIVVLAFTMALAIVLVVLVLRGWRHDQ
jgi:hypothetical protein